MNKWKVAFFTLFAAVILVLAVLVALLFSGERVQLQPAQQHSGNVVMLQTTGPELEAIARYYLQDTITQSPVPFDFSITDAVNLTSELEIFGVAIPVAMSFDPVVHEDGNISLEQQAMNIGNLSLPPQYVLKLIGQAVQFPDWVTVQSTDSSIYIDLSRLNIDSGTRVRAKKLDLVANEIQIELIIPTTKEGGQ
ncbi:MAG: YpmS family protein [Caryophanon sp.]|nr:YpmS family protein [Caryophanon sp.]